MNKNDMLKEMGITAYVSKEVLEVQASPSLDAPSSMDATSYVDPNAPVMWTLALKDSDSIRPLRDRIVRVIKHLGVEVQILNLASSSAPDSSQIQGGLLIGLGQEACNVFSGESSPVHELREIVFEAKNARGVDIPVLVSHDPVQVLKNAKFKRELWEDIVMARTLYLEANF